MTLNLKSAFFILIVVVLGIAVIYRVLVAFLIPGATVTSWFRTIAHNREIGGVSNSRHLWGWAIDIVPVTSKNITAMRKIFRQVVNEGDHIHGEGF